jgi:two-component system, NarL family, response regulator DevR
MRNRPRVLLADDHAGVAKALVRLFSLDCDVVEIVTDGTQVADAVARLQPVVTVMDLNLLSVNGLDVCRQILRANPSAKVILITGMMDEGLKAEALAAGAVAFFPKLTSGNELVEAIHAAWAESSDRRD